MMPWVRDHFTTYPFSAQPLEVEDFEDEDDDDEDIDPELLAEALRSQMEELEKLRAELLEAQVGRSG